MAYHISEIVTGDSVDLQRARVLLLDAVTRDHIHLYRQSIFRPNDPRPAYWEVLVRIEDERGKMHLPADFLNQSERLDLAHPLDRIIINESMHRWRRHSDAGQAIPITINLSAQTAETDMAEYVIGCAAQWDVPHHQVTLEIPNTTVIENKPAATAFIGMLSAAGFQLALDGFDGGAALLSVTEELNFDFVKLDGALSQWTVTNPVYRDYVGALIPLAHAH
ncbi:MAG: EAL domain-containing protein, partial [Chloroflexi bacterium]|nr:EAL domain-containing protein [Chloroflexota bacterium]